MLRREEITKFYGENSLSYRNIYSKRLYSTHSIDEKGVVE